MTEFLKIKKIFKYYVIMFNFRIKICCIINSLVKNCLIKICLPLKVSLIFPQRNLSTALKPFNHVSNISLPSFFEQSLSIISDKQLRLSYSAL